MKHRKPIEEHPAVMRFRSSVARLIKPSLSPLYAAFIDTKRELQDERAALEKELDELQMDGFEAAARLVLPAGDFGRGYFDRIDDQRGKRND